MFLVTQNTKTKQVAVYEVNQKADLDRFETDASIPQEIAGWPVKTAADLGKTALGNKDLLALYNAAVETPLVKFQDKQSAMERTFGVFPKIANPIADLFPAEKPKKTAPAPKAPAAPKATSPKKTTESSRQKGKIDLEPQTKAYPCREGTKQALLIDCLAKGATIEELIKACDKASGGKTSWTETSVRSGIYWDVNKVKGYGIRTEFDAKGTPRYFLVYPKGSDAPVPHKARAAA
jgi:hypothetical protein